MNTNATYIFGAVVIAFALIAGATLSSGTSSAEQNSTLLPGAGFADAYAATPDALIIDVRTPQEYEEGHIAGAINIDQESASFDTEIAKLDTAKTYFVYCRSGRRSALATAHMHAAGINHIYELSGGIVNAPELIAATSTVE